MVYLREDERGKKRAIIRQMVRGEKKGIISKREGKKLSRE